MGLLDSFFGNADQTQAIGLLGAGLMARNPAAGFANANQFLGGAADRDARRQLLAAQLQETQAQALQRQTMAQKEQQAMEQQARLRAGLPGLFPSGGLSGGQPIPQTEGGIPMFSKPMGVAPMQSAPGGFDVKGAIGLGMDPDSIQKYAGLSNIGRPEVARTVEGRDAQGRPVTIQYDKYGQPVGQAVEQWKAPVFEGLGNRRVAIDPVSLKERASFGVGQSPDSVASNAVAWANANETRRHNGVSESNAAATRADGAIPSGYRRKADGSGLEFIPGGPADPAAAKKAAPTEFQGKSTTFGARMTDAAKVIDDLEGKVSPSNVARSGYKAEFPGWVPGGQLVGAGLTAANKLTTPDDAQRYYQAQENWVTANLRQESGAAIGKDEMAKDIAKWFPQPGEPDAVKQQKAAARKVAERAMVVQAGPGASSIAGIVDGSSSTAQAGGGVDWKFVNGKLVKVK